MRNPVLGITPHLRVLRCEESLDLRIAHRDARIDLAFAQPLDDDFLADVLAVFLVLDVLLLERLAELVGRQLVVLRDAQDGALDLRVVDANAVLLGELQDRTLGDDPVEQLLLEHIGGRRRHLLRLHLRENGPLLLVDLELRHRLVVDDGDHAVEEHAAVGRRTRRVRGCRPRGRCARLGGRRRRALRQRGSGNNGDRQRGETAKKSGKRHAVTLTRSV